MKKLTIFLIVLFINKIKAGPTLTGSDVSNAVSAPAPAQNTSASSSVAVQNTNQDQYCTPGQTANISKGQACCLLKYSNDVYEYQISNLVNGVCPTTSPSIAPCPSKGNLTPGKSCCLVKYPDGGIAYGLVNGKC